MIAFGVKKLDEVYGFMDTKKLDAFMFYNLEHCKDVNIKYFTGFEGEGCFLLSRNVNILFVHPLEIKNVKCVNVDEIVKMERKLIKDKIKNLKRIGVVGNTIPFSFTNFLKKQGIKIFDVKEFFDKLRSIKLKGEIKLIEKSCKITNKILSKLEKLVHKGIKEVEIRNFILDLVVKKNMSLAFEPIVAFDERSASPHPIPRCSNRKLKQIGYVDFGICYKGYNSDVTLPFVVEINEKIERVINTVSLAEKTVVDKIKSGELASEVFKTVEKIFEENGFKQEHALGHGIGLGVHESPSISSKSKEILRKSMVLAIEPSIYLKNFGVRLENNFVILRNKCKILTTSRIKCLHL
jgi:Xaa-Pro aminopeptidase